MPIPDYQATIFPLVQFGGSVKFPSFCGDSNDDYLDSLWVRR
jgi:hypothetical protein